MTSAPGDRDVDGARRREFDPREQPHLWLVHPTNDVVGDEESVQEVESAAGVQEALDAVPVVTEREVDLQLNADRERPIDAEPDIDRQVVDQVAETEAPRRTEARAKREHRRIDEDEVDLAEVLSGDDLEDRLRVQPAVLVKDDGELKYPLLMQVLELIEEAVLNGQALVRTSGGRIPSVITEGDALDQRDGVFAAVALSFFIKVQGDIYE